jgi:hypothetical protein
MYVWLSFQEIMIDPAIAIDGHSYERQAMEKWLTAHATSPKTNEKLPTKILIPNLALRSRIHNFVDMAHSAASAP